MAKGYFTLLLLCVSALAQADVELDFGQTKRDPMHHGLYVQDDYDHSVRYTSPYAALRYVARGNTFGVGVEVFNQFSYETHSDTTTHEVLWGHGGRKAAGERDSHCSTEGSTIGIGLFLTAAYGRFELEAGPTLNRSDWHLQIYSSRFPGAPTVDRRERTTDIGYAFGWSFRLTNNLFVGQKFYYRNDSSKDEYPSDTGNARTIHLRYRFSTGG